ncbi:MAG: cardiolipin synthase, partial [Streptococcus gallolyticus]
ECATYMYKVDAIQDIYKDCLQTLKDCKRVTPEMVNNRPAYEKIIGLLVKTIAPLM